jgi:hypothetical protein
MEIKYYDCITYYVIQYHKHPEMSSISGCFAKEFFEISSVYSYPGSSSFVAPQMLKKTALVRMCVWREGPPSGKAVFAAFCHMTHFARESRPNGGTTGALSNARSDVISKSMRQLPGGQRAFAPTRSVAGRGFIVLKFWERFAALRP